MNTVRTQQYYKSYPFVEAREDFQLSNEIRRISEVLAA